MQLLNVIILGIVEGLTEFIPVSSTGHLILMSHVLGFSGMSGTFEIFIQLGAILAIVVIYYKRFLTSPMPNAPYPPMPGKLYFLLAIACLPAFIIGFFTHDFIKEQLFSPIVVAVSLIIGGILIFIIEKYAPEPVFEEADDFDWKMALKIGFCQCIAMIPGVSRSGATIMGALVFGAKRKVATEFSFLLAVPTLLAATLFELYNTWNTLSQNDITILALGTGVSFISSLFVIKWLIGFVSSHTFKIFGWYRIALGIIILMTISF